jgi:hypothetical protein
VIKAVLVIINNYFHDLAVAFLFASTLMAHLALRHWPGPPSDAFAVTLRKIAYGSLAWVLLGGVVRVWFFKEYEWVPAAGNAIIPALMVKHIFLVTLTVWGLVGIVRLGRSLEARN